MPSVTVSDDQGQLMVTVDGGQPTPVQTAEEACSIIEQTFGQPDGDEQSPAMADEAMAAGFKGVRGNGLNG